MRYIFAFTQGRSTFFALFFVITAFILALRGQLTHEYIALATLFQSLILGHSVKEDYFSRNTDDSNGN